MVLRIKEREEAIQLLAMDPQVCGKLLTLRRKGNGVDVQALRDQIPLRQDAGKGPQMGSHGYRRLRWWKSVFVAPPDGFGVYEYIWAKELGQETSEGPTRQGARPTPWACPPPSWPSRCFSDFISKSPGLLLVQERSSRKFYSVWTPLGIRFLQNSKTGENRNWHWALG